MAAARVTPGDVLAGKYRVERVLGEGGMGVVVAAFHLALEQRVAVKFLRKDMADRGDAAERFRREARAVAKIRSEHVARVLDVGTMEDGETYIVMEYLDGNDLSAEMHRRGALPVAEAVDIALQIADAVGDAHASGIIHRDLKPANVFLVRRSDGTRLAKVLDFGISKSLLVDSASNVSLTQTSTVMGSPLYMSPEQMRSARDVDTRTDIWALGAILYEALAGMPPHAGASLPEICTSLLHDAPRPIEEFRSDLPPGLTAVVMRCLAKDRAERWPTVNELMTALTPFVRAPAYSLAATIGSVTPPVIATPGATAPGTSGTKATPAGVSVPVGSPRVSTGSGARASMAGSPVPSPGITESPASLTLSSPKDGAGVAPSRSTIFAGLFGAALLIATIGFLFVRFGGIGTEEMTTKRPDDVARVEPPPPPVPAAAAPSVAPVVPAVVPAPEPSTLPTAETAAPVKPVSNVAARPNPQLVRERGTRPVEVVPKRPPTQAEAITDFGGRR